MTMNNAINLDEKNMKQGVMGLVLVLVEIIRDTLRLQAMKRIEGERLTDDEIERLGCALEALDNAIEQIKSEQEVVEEVKKIRSRLDGLANDLIHEMINPRTLKEECRKEEALIYAARKATE